MLSPARRNHHATQVYCDGWFKCWQRTQDIEVPREACQQCRHRITRRGHLVECRRENVTEEGIEVGKKNSRFLHSATVGVCDFFILLCSLRPESSQEHLQTSIAGVLRLRAIKLSVCDRSAKRFAQDDGFVGGLEYNWLNIQKTRKDRKSHRRSRWQFGLPGNEFPATGY
jgi:hypothetical protein